MNLDHLSPLRRRILALAILFSLVLMVVSAIVVPYVVVAKGYDKEMERLNGKLESYHAFVRDGEAARNQLRTLERIESTNGFFIASQKPALASAELQRRVKQVIEQSGGTVVSSQMMGEKDTGGIEQVVLRVQMRCGVAELQKVFHTIEGQSPVLIMDNIYLAARPAGGYASSRDKGSLQQLDVRFDVAGHRKPLDEQDDDSDKHAVVSTLKR